MHCLACNENSYDLGNAPVVDYSETLILTWIAELLGDASVPPCLQLIEDLPKMCSKLKSGPLVFLSEATKLTKAVVE